MDSHALDSRPLDGHERRHGLDRSLHRRGDRGVLRGVFGDPRRRLRQDSSPRAGPSAAAAMGQRTIKRFRLEYITPCPGLGNVLYLIAEAPPSYYYGPPTWITLPEQRG